MRKGYISQTFIEQLETFLEDIMGTGRTLNKKPATRPVKCAGERRRRDALQRKRLVAMGMDEAVAAKLNAVEIRDLLRTPVKTKAALAK